jgi:WD repeat-containing protein 23
MRSPTEVRDPDATICYGLRGWDYRNGRYRKPRYIAHPQDCSVMTYRGMRTLRTLIRCAFSPTSTTGGSYIYTGGYVRVASRWRYNPTTLNDMLHCRRANGVIYIFALDGRIVQGKVSQVNPSDVQSLTVPCLAVLDRTQAIPLRQPDGSYSDPSAPLETVSFDPDPVGDINCTVRDVR